MALLLMDLLELCIPVVNIMKMCMWIFDGPIINFERITAFRTYELSHFLAAFLHCRV